MAELARLQTADLRRSLIAVTPDRKYIHHDGKPLLNLASNDYLALSHHPRLIDAAVQATRDFGVGAGASRLVTGTLPLHEAVEQQFAEWKHAQAGLLLATGYTANLAALTALAGRNDHIILDKRVHASLIDAAQASRAHVSRYAHLQLDHAEKLLQRDTPGRRLIVTDSVFSMDGDCADLPALCELADRYAAVLIVDEAHGTGVLGDDGSGLAKAQGVAERVYQCGAGGVLISTASKAMGSLGGLITASRPVIDLIINRARSFIYSTAVPPAQAAAIGAAIDVIRNEAQRRMTLSKLAIQSRTRLAELGWAMPERGQAAMPTPIIPLIVGDAAAAIRLSMKLREQGIYAPAIRPPTVAPGTARVRLSLRADLDQGDIDRLIQAVGSPSSKG